MDGSNFIPDDNSDGGQPTPGMHPALEAFQQIPWAPGADAWARDSATIVNDHIQKAQIADANQQAGQNFVDNIGRFRDGLKNWVQGDPTAVHSALALIPHTIGSLIDSNPVHPDEQRQDAHDQIVGDLQQQVARSAVQRMAELHGPSARQMLADPRIGDVLDDQDHAGLNSYIDLQDLARNADGAAQQRQAMQVAAQQSAGAALGHLGTLYNPTIDDTQFPQGWAASLMANNAIMPADKMALMHVYGRLQTQGDAPQSDAFEVHRMVDGIAAGQPPSHADLLNSAANSLRLADAVHLAPGALPLDQQHKAYFSTLSDALGRARAMLAGPDGENGAAGAAAFQRYVNFLMPNVRAGGMAAVMPALMALPRFTPSGNDVQPAVPREGRPSLARIFGGV